MSPPLARRRNVSSLQHHLSTPVESNNKSGGKKNEMTEAGEEDMENHSLACEVIIFFI